MDSLVRQLREKGLKVTPQRVTIYGLLVGTKEHPTAEQLWEEVKKEHAAVSFNTVYTTLSTLVDAGLIQKLHIGSASRYDATQSPHTHLHCQVCGRADDCSDDFGADWQSIKPRIYEKVGFRAEKVEMSIYGICAACALTRN